MENDFLYHWRWNQYFVLHRMTLFLVFSHLADFSPLGKLADRAIYFACVRPNFFLFFSPLGKLAGRAIYFLF